jgi:pimeloyl-ACP methyl ester carboxylesterase
MKKSDVEFASIGAKLRGWLFRGQSNPAPTIIMAHGFSATRQMVIDRYAEAFASAGLNALVYDHRGFGASDGDPRLEVNPWVQARGYLDALDFASKLDGVDKNRLALWGDSNSAGVASMVTAIDRRVRAAVLQVPSFGESAPPDDPDGKLFNEQCEAIRSGEVLGFGRPTMGPVPVVSADQVRSPSALKPLTAFRWFIEYGGRLGSGWVNDVTVALGENPLPWRPGLSTARIDVPVLMIVSGEDEMARADPAVTRTVFDQLRGPKEWHQIRGGHFGLLYFPSELFSEAQAVQVAFARRWLIERS